jgi:AAHS family 4-hydroxybenzoate transporter-like MFS transporter
MWVCFASALMANFFLNSWLPLILEGDGLTSQRSGVAISLYHYGGVLGGFLVSLVLRPLGFAAMALLFLFAAFAIAAIGTPGISYTTLVAFVSLAGFCTLGSQFGNNAAAGLLYPAAFRSRGVGWALGIGRVGSIAGPLVGGMLIARQLPPEKLFLLASLPMVVGMVAAAMVAGLSYKILGSTKLDEIREE